MLVASVIPVQVNLQVSVTERKQVEGRRTIYLTDMRFRKSSKEELIDLFRHRSSTNHDTFYTAEVVILDCWVLRTQSTMSY